MSKLEKVEIIPGMYWISIREVGLSLQCGCPEDSVKHLRKRGIIVSTEIDGVLCESGPNAILLSDVSTQNGQFANLAEFPVLQMQYLQGMILPGHPNNTGIKPLLIGAEEQVISQLAYITRGSYGLLSEEEIVQTGVSPALAKEVMRMKLKFAFGKIRGADEFLDPRIIGNGTVEIGNSVFIRRLRVNVFEIEYQDSTVTVDLNLPSNQNYQSPYHLNFHNIKREYFAVLHSGEGDGWDINRPCMSSILMFQGRVYLIDVGPNIVSVLKALGIGINEIEGIFHTHAHDDHFAGMTVLLQSDHKIKYYATPLVRVSVFKKLSALTSIEETELYSFFEIHDLEFDVWNEINGMEVTPNLSPHPVETSVFTFRTIWEDGHRSYAHFADIISLEVLKDMVEADLSKPGVTQDMFNNVKRNYLVAANVKKIDIGEGMIHGNAYDFKDDASEHILLSHTSTELTGKQKVIGSGAPFGMVDVIIPARQNYLLQYAARYLDMYFPFASIHHKRILLNSSLVTFNPEKILLKEDEISNQIFLILTGNVEQIQPALSIYNVLSAGSLVGEISDLAGVPSMGTYRALGFVQALQIPSRLFDKFVRKTGVYKDIEKLQDHMGLLRSTHLFGGLSYPVQSKIANAMQLESYSAAKKMPRDRQQDILFLKSGAVDMLINGSILEVLQPGQVWGEEQVLLAAQNRFDFQTVTEVEVYRISGKLLLEIPIVHWKLLEIYQKRLQASKNYFMPESRKHIA